jgi:hypothetical protein
LRADVVIVAGLLEGRCPASPPASSPWSEKDAGDVGMPDRRGALREVEHLLAHAMNAAPRVVLSHAQLNEDESVGLPARAYEELRERLEHASAAKETASRLDVRRGCSEKAMAERLALLPGSALSQAGRSRRPPRATRRGVAPNSSRPIPVSDGHPTRRAAPARPCRAVRGLRVPTTA